MYCGRYFTADILWQTYYGGYVMADILGPEERALLDTSRAC